MVVPNIGSVSISSPNWKECFPHLGAACSITQFVLVNRAMVVWRVVGCAQNRATALRVRQGPKLICQRSLREHDDVDEVHSMLPEPLSAVYQIRIAIAQLSSSRSRSSNPSDSPACWKPPRLTKNSSLQATRRERTPARCGAVDAPKLSSKRRGSPCWCLRGQEHRELER